MTGSLVTFWGGINEELKSGYKRDCARADHHAVRPVDGEEGPNTLCFGRRWNASAGPRTVAGVIGIKSLRGGGTHLAARAARSHRGIGFDSRQTHSRPIGDVQLPSIVRRHTRLGAGRTALPLGCGRRRIYSCRLAHCR